MSEIDVEIDGIWCPRCEEFHPVLLWHERYDDYAGKETRLAEWLRCRRERPHLLAGCEPPDVSCACFGVVENAGDGPCAACGAATRFADAESGERVCCAECRAARREASR